MNSRTQILLALVAWIMLFALAGQAQAQDLGKGHVVFFNGISANTPNATEVAHDHRYTYNNIQAWLNRNGLAHSYQETLEFSIKPANHETLTFSTGTLATRVGVLMVRPDGTYRVLKGVHTDIELKEKIDKYFFSH